MRLELCISKVTKDYSKQIRRFPVYEQFTLHVIHDESSPEAISLARGRRLAALTSYFRETSRLSDKPESRGKEQRSEWLWTEIVCRPTSL